LADLLGADLVKYVYDKNFYDAQSDFSLKSARTVTPIIFDILKPKSVVDFGCGVGTWLIAFEELGVADYLGIDGNYVSEDSLQISPKRFRAMDLTKPIQLEKRYDLACALEVAEHLPETSADDFVESLTNASDFVLFSAAVPGQGGTFHLNEQWQDYWRAKFLARSYVAVDLVRPKVWGSENVGFWYQQNTILYVRQGQALNSLPLEQNFQASLSLNIVHAQLYEKECFRDPTLGEIIAAVPRVVLRSLIFHARNFLNKATRE